MSGIKWINRKIEINKEEAKRIRKEILPKAKNNIERKRINSIIAYLNWMSTLDIYKKLWISKNVVTNVTNLYMKDKDNFYQTNYKWKIETQEWKIITERVINILNEYNESGKIIDIQTLWKEYNKRYKSSKILEYDQVWYIVRRKCKFNYQKPYIKDKRQPKKAKKILKDSIQEWYEKALEKEWIEVIRLKNKKISNQANIN